jgi:Asp-tRNA(Asn)/Glu-tRNA(Gln) amidotransferase B subunit
VTDEIAKEYFKEIFCSYSNPDLVRMMSNTAASLGTIDIPIDEYPEDTILLIHQTYFLFEALSEYIMVRKYQLLAKWFINKLIPLSKKLKRDISTLVAPELMLTLLDKVFSGELSDYQARQIFPYLVDSETFEEAFKKSKKDLQV